MANNMIGSGFVVLAYTIKECSLIPGVFLLILLAGIACISQIVITRSCRITEKYTYREMGTVIFGSFGGVIISLIMLLYTCNSCITYLAIIGDLFVDVLSFYFPPFSLDSCHMIILGFVCVFLLFPICLLKSLDSMKCFSMFSILFTFIVVGTVLGQFVSDPLVSDTVEIWHITGSLFGVIPVMCVSFNCHYNVPRYYYELKDRSPGRMWMTSIGSISVILFVYLIIALSGYLMFGVDTEGNLLRNFSHESLLPILSRCGLGFGLICHFPIVYFAIRENLHQLFCSSRPFNSPFLRVTTLVGVLLLTVTLSYYRTEIEIVLRLNGSLFGSLIMFAIPGLMYITATWREKGLLKKKLEAWFMFLFGILLCIGGSFLNVYRILHK
ncbi:hypothetical protein WA171_005579 [Blastocystis sp. BT1]